MQALQEHSCALVLAGAIILKYLVQPASCFFSIGAVWAVSKNV